MINTKLPKSVVFIFFILFSILLIGKNMQSKWWIIDDHEIMAYIKTDNRLPPSKWFESLKGSEAFHPGKSQRYRPVYYAFRFTEMAFWGKDVFIWYLVRFFFFVFFLFMSWLALRKYLNDLESIMFVIYTISVSFIPDVTLRLGPAETYALVGLPLFLYSFIKLTRFENKKINWIMFFIGFSVLVGIKENFLVLLIPITYLTLQYTILKKWNLIGISAVILSYLFASLVLIATFVSSQKYGQDIYTQSTGLGSRFKLLGNGFNLLFSYPETKILIFILITSTCFTLYKSGFKKNISQFKTIVLIFSLSLIFVSQFVFYNGIWPQGNRYDFPGLLVIKLFVLISLVIIKGVVNSLNIYIPSFKIVKNYMIVFLLTLIILFSYKDFLRLRKFVNINLAQTKLFDSQIKMIANAAMGNDYSIVFYSNFDVEPLAAVRRFLLYYYGLDRKYYIVTKACTSQDPDNWKKYLANTVCTWSKGNKDFAPANQIANDNNLCINFGGVLTEETKRCVKMFNVSGGISEFK